MADAIREAGGTCALFQADVSDVAQAAASWSKRVQESLGGLDILVNNAGTTRG